MQFLTRFFIAFGILFVTIGIMRLVFPTISLYKLPGVVMNKGNFVLIFPVGACLLLSAIITIIQTLVLRK